MNHNCYLTIIKTNIHIQVLVEHIITRFGNHYLHSLIIHCSALWLNTLFNHKPVVFMSVYRSFTLLFYPIRVVLFRSTKHVTAHRCRYLPHKRVTRNSSRNNNLKHFPLATGETIKSGNRVNKSTWNSKWNWLHSK